MLLTVNLRDNSHYQRALSVHFSGFKLATSTHALSTILDAYHSSDIPQALHSNGALCLNNTGCQSGKHDNQNFFFSQKKK